MLKRTLIPLFILLGLGAVAAFGDWDPDPAGDPKNHKMHFPQMPDAFGWDVAFRSAPNNLLLADDWKCSKTGAVNDIHFWVSFREGTIVPLDFVRVEIWSNDPGPPSKPRDRLWERRFGPDQFSMRDYGTGVQGWFDPVSGLGVMPDHNHYQQINIVDIEDPFTQDEGEIYWLALHVIELDPGKFGKVGWKTSLDHFEDDAVWMNTSVGIGEWRALHIEGEPVDFAFVITPEPATMCMLGAGSLVLLLHRRRKSVAR
jgi:hypothetical protein